MVTQDRSVATPVADIADCYNGRMPAVDAFRTTLDLFDTGVALMRQTLRRRYPQAADSEIEQRLRDWLWHRPGAESGDAEGRRVTLDDRGR